MLESLRQDPRRIIAVVVGLVLALLMLPPLWILLQDSLTTTDDVLTLTRTRRIGTIVSKKIVARNKVFRERRCALSLLTHLFRLSRGVVCIPSCSTSPSHSHRCDCRHTFCSR